MAIRAVSPQDLEQLPTVEEVMERLGLDRDAADLYLAVKSGWALVGDRVCVPSEQREQVLRELQQAADEYYAAVEEGVKHLDHSATVEENMQRTGLDRHAVEVYLRLRRGESAAVHGAE